MEIFRKFKIRFDKNDSIELASEADLKKINSELRIILPDDYKLFLTKFGNIYTPDILDVIVDKEIDLNDIQQFWTIEEIIYDKQKAWTAQLSIDLIPFASDSMGNIFGFLADDLKKESKSCSVHFFDHDFDTIEKVADSFSEWIEHYNQL